MDKKKTLKCPRCECSTFRAKLVIANSKSQITLICGRADGTCRAEISFNTSGGKKQ